ncbi:MAG: tRNA (N6-isopentenyl adenosine(37)-C2)-methylthiotransferase MiaB [Clostridia bacterium]|nr:tRNA (N6-isopentenyl adenosine(37)-C2)-methylthiotransferase MiaB [Clostridia bacterium]
MSKIQYFIESYGCQMNDHDSEKIAGMLQKMGYDRAKNKFDADIIIFNTCCVREHAELRVFGNVGALKKLKDENPELINAVCGCMMQQQEVAKKLFKRFPYVNIVFGTHCLDKLPDMITQARLGNRVISTEDGNEIIEGLPIIRQNKYQTSVTIMYGCDNYCTYCIVPYVRGHERSRDPENIIAEVEGLVKDGYKEITLLGQNVNSYNGRNGEVDFPKLLHMVADTGIERIRFMTSHPKDLSPKLIEAMASIDAVCNHIHLPVQSGSDRILSRMNRKYSSSDYLKLVSELRNAVKGIEITTDIIVGFPTETDEDFNDTLNIVKAAYFAAAYTFMYSPRAGTPAAKMAGQIPQNIKSERLKILNEYQASTLQNGNLKYIGTTGNVLVEGCDTRSECKQAFGKLSNFKMVYFPGDESLIGKTVNVEIISAKNNSLIGTEVKA